MKYFLSLLLIIISYRSQAQDILYFLPDSVEVNIFNQIQVNKRIVPHSVFIFLEKNNNTYIDILTNLKEATNRIEKSFASKLLATSSPIASDGL